MEELIFVSLLEKEEEDFLTKEDIQEYFKKVSSPFKNKPKSPQIIK